MNLTRTSALAAMLCLAVMTTGCITTVTSPTYARAGDLINVGLGGTKRNVTSNSLSFPDFSATITDSDSVVHNLTIHAVFRAYPDYTSWYARDSLDRADLTFGNVEPYDGMLWATLKLSDASGTPLPLATGPATIAITSPQLVDTGWQLEGTLSSFQVEIIPGTRTPTNEEEQQFTAYRPQPALSVAPDNLGGVAEIGGFQIAITYNTSAISTATPVVEPRLVPFSHDPNITLIQSTVDNGDGTKTLTAMVTNPNGFVPNADLGGSWAIGKSTFDDLEFALIATDTSNFANWASDYSIDSANSYYIDLNGDPIAGVNPTLSRSL